MSAEIQRERWEGFDLQIGDQARLLVLPYTKGVVVAVRDGTFEREITVRAFGSEGSEATAGARHVGRFRQPGEGRVLKEIYG